MKYFLNFLGSLLLFFTAAAQDCNAPGQKPSTAFPVCGTSVFTQTTVPLCAGRALPSPSCNSDPISDINPFWYKFTCFQPGTLGFTITPKNLSDDYDWELYDVTDKNPNDIYTNGKMVVSSNWSGEGGKTGAGNGGNNLFVCAGFGKPLFSKMPDLIQGHNYLLLISHFTQSQSGYDLEFKGGTAVITDSLPPLLKKADVSCNGNILRLALNKKVKCSSIAANGSDFFITPSTISITKAIAANCVSGFDADSLELQLSGIMAPGTYRLQVKKGTDENSILDICDNAIAASNFVDFIVKEQQPTPMDSMLPVTCAPQTLQLIFSKPVLCNSVAANGSDFEIVGSYGVNIVSAQTNCSGGNTTNQISVLLSRPLTNKGSFSLILKKGEDGNTILDECTQETPAGSTLSFSVKDTVNADFSYKIGYGCQTDTVAFINEGGNETNMWQWNLDEGNFSQVQKPSVYYSIFNQKNIELIVSNGFCTDTVRKEMVLENMLKADFSVLPDNCPQEPVLFSNTSIGKIINHQWTFGDGGNSVETSPQHTYLQPNIETSFPVRLAVTDSWGCEHAVSKSIKIYSSCILYVPNAFTPDNDGKNDFFRILNAVKADKFEMKIFNRWGQLLFSEKDWRKGWDGKYKGMQQGSGTYVWMIRYTDLRTGRMVQQKGTFNLIR